MSFFRNSQRWLRRKSASYRFGDRFNHMHRPVLEKSNELKVVWFSSSGNNNIRFPEIHGDNPFDILGIPKNSSYESVKRRFIELAMKTHPDISSDSDEDEDPGSAENFIHLRQAFEAISEASDGSAKIVGNKKQSSWSDDNFKAWFFEETGHQDIMFTMDLATRKEVVNMVETQSQGGLDKGGMWEMARNMAEQEKSLKNQKQNHAKTPVGLKAGTQGTASSARRRRRRK